MSLSPLTVQIEHRVDRLGSQVFTQDLRVDIFVNMCRLIEHTRDPPLIDRILKSAVIDMQEVKLLTETWLIIDTCQEALSERLYKQETLRLIHADELIKPARASKLLSLSIG